MELLDILGKINKEKEIARKDLSELDERVRGSWVGRINEAKINFEKYKGLYGKVLFETAYPVVVTGDTPETVGLLESYKTGVEMNVNGMYEGLAEQLFHLIGGSKTWLVAFNNHLTALFRNWVTPFGLQTHIKPVGPAAEVIIESKGELAFLVKNWVIQSNGHRPAMFYNCQKLREKCIDLGLTAEVYVLITGCQEKQEALEYVNLFKNPAIQFDAKSSAKDNVSEIVSKYAKTKQKKVQRTTGKV